MLILSPFKLRTLPVFTMQRAFVYSVQYVAMAPPRTQTKAAIGCSSLFIGQCQFLQILFPVVRERLLCYFTVFIYIKNSFIDINKSVHLLISINHLWIELQSSIY